MTRNVNGIIVVLANDRHWCEAKRGLADTFLEFKNAYKTYAAQVSNKEERKECNEYLLNEQESSTRRQSSFLLSLSGFRNREGATAQR